MELITLICLTFIISIFSFISPLKSEFKLVFIILIFKILKNPPAKEGVKRNLAFPQAIKATNIENLKAYRTNTISQSNSLTYGKIQISLHPIKENYAFFASYNSNTKQLNLLVLDNTQKNSGAQSLFIKKTIIAGYHHCKTHQIRHLPIGYIHHFGKDYIATFTTGLKIGGKCPGVYGKYWLYVDDYFDSSWSMINSLSTNQGVTAFYDPQNIGLSAFSGYAKCVDILITKVGIKPFVVSLVFYEDE